MKTKKVRDSRLEILRIIAMLLIILHHMALYSGMLESQMVHVKIIGEFIIIGLVGRLVAFYLLSYQDISQRVQYNLVLGKS